MVKRQRTGVAYRRSANSRVHTMTNMSSTLSKNRAYSPRVRVSRMKAALDTKTAVKSWEINRGVEGGPGQRRGIVRVGGRLSLHGVLSLHTVIAHARDKRE